MVGAMVPRQQVPLRPAAEALADMQLAALTRACIATVAGKFDPNLRRSAFVRQRWGDEAPAVESVLKAASAPATTSQVGWAQELAPVVSVFLDALQPVSAGADLLSRAIGLSFDGAKTLNVPNVVVPLADFVGEGGMIPIVQGVSSIQATLAPTKFAVIVVLSRETTESSNAEALVRIALLESTGPSLDRRLFDADPAVADVRPAGLLNGITPLTPSTNPGGKSDAMLDDLEALLSAVAPVAGNSEIVVIAAPAQAVSIGLRSLQSFEHAVLTSSQLATGTVIAVAVRAVVVAGGDAPLIDTTRSASVQMDDAPTGDLMTGGSVVATFQNDIVGLRLRWPLSWTVRDGRGIAWMQNVTW
jgi:hypothetical protein